jgi:flagellar FliJ protein
MALSPNVLNTLLDSLKGDLDVAVERMAKAKKGLDEAKANGTMLNGYRQDYVENLVTLMEKGFTKEIYSNYQNFLIKLDQAIAGQMDVIFTAEYEHKKEREIWQELQRKKLSYETLLKRNTKRAHHVALKVDQKMMDEYAMRAKRSRAF